MRTDRIQLADLIEQAADEFLVPPGSRQQQLRSMSCCAAWDAISARFEHDPFRRHAARHAFDDLVYRMGLNVCSSFGSVKRGKQATRHAWLYLVAQFAREENIEV